MVTSNNKQMNCCTALLADVELVLAMLSIWLNFYLLQTSLLAFLTKKKQLTELDVAATRVANALKFFSLATNFSLIKNTFAGD